MTGDLPGPRLMPFEELSADAQELAREAMRASDSAYARYSGFRVGSAILCSDGTFVSGCNVENASYGLTMCAEMGAVAAAVRAGKLPLLAMAVYGKSVRKAGTRVARTEAAAIPVVPCGRCRQIISEMGRDAVVYCVSSDMTWVLVAKASELLPAAFSGTLLDPASTPCGAQNQGSAGEGDEGPDPRISPGPARPTRVIGT